VSLIKSLYSILSGKIQHFLKNFYIMPIKKPYPKKIYEVFFKKNILFPQGESSYNCQQYCFCFKDWKCYLVIFRMFFRKIKQNNIVKFL